MNKINNRLLLLILIVTSTTFARNPFIQQATIEQSPLTREIITSPLTTQAIKINHLKVEQVMMLLKAQAVLTESGLNVIVDQRTNQLIVQGSQPNIHQLDQLIKKLDVPMPQVMIQARIMNLDRKFERSLGIAFGVTQLSHVSGTLQGAQQLANNALDGQLHPAADVPLSERLNVDFPATIDGIAQAPSLGLAFVKLGQGLLLDLELSAVEAEGGGQLLSAPHLMTTNRESAFIEAGEEIPYEETTNGGGTAVAFKKAVLGLRVTPEILANHDIALDIKVSQDKRGNEVVHGEPSIDTRQLATHVMVKDGETVVLGGIFEQRSRTKVVRVPFLGDIPGLGNLFKSQYKANEQYELLIFLTPSLVAAS